MAPTRPSTARACRICCPTHRPCRWLAGPHHDRARQFKIGTIEPVKFFIDTDKLTNPNKTAYAAYLPTPEVGGVSALTALAA
jgi:hypothetical protein